MSNVTIEIAGRSYTVACQDGQEQHIAKLGRAIDAKLLSLQANVRQNEARTLLFASLLLADEADELRNRKPAPPPVQPAPVQAIDPSLAPALESLADRLEKLAQSLEA